ncbi:hypothetical protein NN561_005896 [Cricetulus griseus]
MPSSYPSSAIQGSRGSYRERKGNPDDPGYKGDPGRSPVHRGKRVISHLVDRTVATMPFNKSPFPSGCAASGSGCPCGGAQRPRGALGGPCVRPAPGPAWRDSSRPAEGTRQRRLPLPTLPSGQRLPDCAACVCRSGLKLNIPNACAVPLKIRRGR